MSDTMKCSCGAVATWDEEAQVWVVTKDGKEVARYTALCQSSVAEAEGRFYCGCRGWS